MVRVQAGAARACIRPSIHLTDRRASKMSTDATDGWTDGEPTISPFRFLSLSLSPSFFLRFHPWVNLLLPCRRWRQMMLTTTENWRGNGQPSLSNPSSSIQPLCRPHSSDSTAPAEEEARRTIAQMKIMAMSHVSSPDERCSQFQPT